MDLQQKFGQKVKPHLIIDFSLLFMCQVFQIGIHSFSVVPSFINWKIYNKHIKLGYPHPNLVIKN